MNEISVIRYDYDNLTPEQIKNEIWKPCCKGEIYTVSNMGRIYSSKINNTLKQVHKKANSYSASLTISGFTKQYQMDYLILQTFDPKDNEEDYEIIHVNGNRSDNRYENLKWSLKSQLNHEDQVLVDLKNEEWKPIYDFPNYLISDKGRVKTLKGELIKFRYIESEKFIANIYQLKKDKNAKYVEIDRYVMYTFSPCENMKDMIIIHINGNSRDNTLTNLKYEPRNGFRKKDNNEIVDTKETDEIVDTKETDNEVIDTKESDDEIDYSTEEWKFIEGSNGQYVSSFGRVKNQFKIRKLTPLTDGYLMTNIRFGKIKKSFPVHRLVLFVFQPNEKFEDLEVNHKDGNKWNNKLDNLEYVTGSQNVQHAHDNGLIISYTTAIKGTHVETGEILEFKSQIEGAKYFNAKRATNINDALLGLKNTAYGYKWEYTNKENRDIKDNEFEDELWKDIYIFGRLTNYKVSSYGRISNQKKILRLYGDDGEYKSIGLQVRNEDDTKTITKSKQVHNLVAEYFLDSPSKPKMKVHHKDEDKTNNHYKNLEYVTHSENVMRSSGNGTVKKLRKKFGIKD